MAADNHVTAPLLVDGVANTENSTSATDRSIKYKYYTLPSLRYSSVVRTIIFIDVISSLALWISGGNTTYFVDNILRFHFVESSFDLALLGAAKIIPLFVLYTSLEDAAFKEIDHPFDAGNIRTKRILHCVVSGLSLVVFGYTVVKGALILHAVLGDPGYTMRLTYYILAVSAVAFSLIELLLSLLSYRYMRRLKVYRVQHWLNDSGHEVDNDGKPLPKKVNLRRLILLIKPESGILSIGVLGLLVSTGATAAQPLFFGKVLDAATKSMEDINRSVITLFLIYVVGSIMAIIRGWLFTLAGHRLVARLRKMLFKSIIRQDIAFFDVSRTGELTNRLSSDTQVVQNAVTVNVSMVARNFLQIIVSLTLMLILNAALTGVLISVIPIVTLGAMQYGRFVKNLRKRFQDFLAEASTTAEETISSIRTVRSFTGEDKTLMTYSSDIDKSYDIGKKLSLAAGMFEGVLGIIANGAITLVLWYGAKLMLEGHVTAGVLTSFLLYTLQIAIAFAMLSSVYGDFMQAVGASYRIFDLLDRQPAVPIEGGLQSNSIDGEIKFEDVRFTYPSRPDSEVLRGVSFSVSSGSIVALVGPSGGGKSTIVSLIERFYDPSFGRILLGGHDIRTLDPQWFRRKIAMVSQEPTLFACSIKDNIAYGKDGSTDEVIETAKQANAHTFIETFEESYDTLVGERGVRLSGGQKQRVAIARALFMDPAILLLDEATSALDAESEHLVQEAIERAMENRTVIVIAHRLSTVRNASKVLVIDKGQIVEAGTHDELLSKDGVYKKLVLRQLMAGSVTVNDNATDTALIPSLTDS